MNLYTAGYEGLSINAFIARLKQAGIDKVLDVREYPLSRKKGFYLSEQSHLLIACCRSPRRINQADNQPLSRKTMEGAH